MRNSYFIEQVVWLCATANTAAKNRSAITFITLEEEILTFSHPNKF